MTKIISVSDTFLLPLERRCLTLAASEALRAEDKNEKAYERPVQANHRQADSSGVGPSQAQPSAPFARRRKDCFDKQRAKAPD